MHGHHIDPLSIPIVAILMPLILVPLLMIMKHRYKRREWEHLERMQAIDSRHPQVRPVGWVGSGGVAAIGAGVPAVAVLGAFLTSYFRHSPYPDHVTSIAWVCAVFISAGGLLTSLALAFLQSRTVLKLDSNAREDREFDHAKPAFDPDTFDVVGTRG